MNVGQSWDAFKNTICQLIVRYIPLKREHKKKKNEWISKATIKKIKEREKCWLQYRGSQLDSDHLVYKKIRNQVSRLIKTDKSQYTKNLVASFKTKPKRFYGYVRNLQAVKNTVTEIRKEDGSLTQTSYE